MPRIYYQPDEREVETEAQETILDTSLRTGVPHTHVCGGKGRCSTCRVKVEVGQEHLSPRNELEHPLAELLCFALEVRLACQTTISGDVRLRRLVLDEEDVVLTDQEREGVTPGSIGEERQVAILIADIREFTSFAEALPAYDVVHALNRYFQAMGKVIVQHGGRIDNYMGDGLLALFGVLDPVGGPLQAVRAGLGMLEAVEALRPYMQAIYERDFRIGLGVHYGQVVIGKLGAPDSQRVTAIGDAVNFASRIEAANKNAGTQFLISEDTYSEVREHVRVGESFPVTLPGKSGEYTLYEVVGLADEA
jgi:adenylate cyclase